MQELITLEKLLVPINANENLIIIKKEVKGPLIAFYDFIVVQDSQILNNQNQINKELLIANIENLEKLAFNLEIEINSQDRQDSINKNEEDQSKKDRKNPIDASFKKAATKGLKNGFCPLTRKLLDYSPDVAIFSGAGFLTSVIDVAIIPVTLSVSTISSVRKIRKVDAI